MEIMTGTKPKGTTGALPIMRSKGMLAQKQVADNQGSVYSLSKQMQLGMSYRLFFPLINIGTPTNPVMDVLTVSVPGRELDRDKLGYTYVTLVDYDVTETGQIIDLTGLDQVARVARVIHDTEHRYEKYKIEKDEKEKAAEMGREIDQVALKVALDKIDLKYEGDMNAKPNKIYPEIKPVVGGKKLTMAVEVIIVPLDAKGAPDFSKSQNASLELKDKKVNQLKSIITNKDYCDGTKEYLEVHYSYIGASKQEAGQSAALVGCSKDVCLETKFPVEWEANKDFLTRLPKSEESIYARNSKFSFTATPRQVMEAFNKYVSTMELALLHIDYEDDKVKAVAKDLLNLDAIKKITKVQDRLIALVNTREEDAEEKDAETITQMEEGELTAGTLEAVKETSTLVELDKKVGGLDDILGDDIDDL